MVQSDGCEMVRGVAALCRTPKRPISARQGKYTKLVLGGARFQAEWGREAGALNGEAVHADNLKMVAAR